MSLNIHQTLDLNGGEKMYFLAELAKAYGVQKANQDALSKCYTVQELSGPKGRLKCSTKKALQLIKDGKLRYETIGESKGYRVSEKAVREFLGDIQRES